MPLPPARRTAAAGGRSTIVRKLVATSQALFLLSGASFSSVGGVALHHAWAVPGLTHRRHRAYRTNVPGGTTCNYPSNSLVSILEPCTYLVLVQVQVQVQVKVKVVHWCSLWSLL